MTNVVMLKRSQFKPAKEVITVEDEEVRALEKVAKRKNKQGRRVLTHAILLGFMVHTGL